MKGHDLRSAATSGLKEKVDGSGFIAVFMRKEDSSPEGQSRNYVKYPMTASAQLPRFIDRLE